MPKFSTLLKKNNIFPKKSLSQSFLTNSDIVLEILSHIKIDDNETILEIGAGTGALTYHLLKRGTPITAVETDSNLIKFLQTNLKDKNLTLLAGDFLKIPMPNCNKIVSNIPYHITSPILQKISEHKSQFSSIFLTVQKEIADRICAPPGKNRSSFTIFVNYHFSPKIILQIPKENFHPEPKVDSTLISLSPKKDQVENPKKFSQFVKTCFHQKRKMLGKKIPHLLDALKKLGIPESIRSEQLSLESFLDLFAYQENQN